MRPGAVADGPQPASPLGRGSPTPAGRGTQLVREADGGADAASSDHFGLLSQLRAGCDGDDGAARDHAYATLDDDDRDDHDDADDDLTGRCDDVRPVTDVDGDGDEAGSCSPAY